MSNGIICSPAERGRRPNAFRTAASSSTTQMILDWSDTRETFLHNFRKGFATVSFSARLGDTKISPIDSIRLRIIGLQVRALPGADQIIEPIGGRFLTSKTEPICVLGHSKITLKFASQTKTALAAERDGGRNKKSGIRSSSAAPPTETKPSGPDATIDAARIC